jgi:alanyl-tRNA synthetase
LKVAGFANRAALEELSTFNLQPGTFAMTSAEIRQSFLDFFKSKQHTIVPSSSLMPDSPNLLFTNAGMNQFVPIFLGQKKADVSKWAGAIPGSDTRAADTQKCIRAGGKHNDLDDVGLDTYHHTFFEMLGNWSFGDYFKKEAIAWAWELIIEVWKFPPQRLYATIYQPDKSKNDPADRDQEAWDLWAEKFRSVGLDPDIHIVNGNKKDNFWMMGETGPCGPCTEMHVDLRPGSVATDLEAQQSGRLLVNGSDARCIEIWNNVFIQYNANPDGTFTPLPAQHVDTGMGFERVTSIIQGTKNLTDFQNAKISNYETDVFRPIFDAIEKLSGKKYGSTLPTATRTVIQDGKTKSVPAAANDDEAKDIAFRVLADHIRTLSFAIADGIEPGNGERNYVLRRILRRAVRYGRTLGFNQPFFYKLVDVLSQTMGEVFPEVRDRQKQIETVLLREENSFNSTLDRGLALFEQEISSLRQLQAHESEGGASELRAKFVLPHEASLSAEQLKQARAHRRAEKARTNTFVGESAFVLYDTYGFPEDLTELLARERGFSLDKAEFKAFMEEQKRIGRISRVTQVIELSQIKSTAPTKFVGYDNLTTKAKVLEVVGIKDKTAVVLDTSTAYAEMGGQVGDTGELSGGGQLWRVTNTQKSGNTWLHFIADTDAPATGSEVEFTVDKARRDAIQRHHTVTHLLHWALHEVVSKEASQKGSAVGPDKLTFDFNAQALTPQQVADIEKLVNERVLENAGVSWTEVPYTDVKNRKDVMQFFGDKYGETVRVVQIGGDAKQLNGYSMELCGGTHTHATGEIGLFRIVGENAVAAGVRRIEAVAGLSAYDVANEQLRLIRSIAGKINSPVHELEKKVEALLAHQKELEKSLRAATQKEAAGRAKELAAKAIDINGTPALIENIGTADGDTVQTVVDALKANFKGVIVLGAANLGAVTLIASVSPDFTAKVQAGKIIQTIAPIVGGKGGGKPDNARGGGKDAGKLDEALAKAKSLLG